VGSPPRSLRVVYEIDEDAKPSASCGWTTDVYRPQCLGRTPSFDRWGSPRGRGLHALSEEGTWLELKVAAASTA
jgi:hypothetical protein